MSIIKHKIVKLKRKNYTEQDYIQKCDELDDIFIGTRKSNRHDTLIEYICKKHKEKGIQSCDWGHFRVQKNSCPYCSGRYKTTEEIQMAISNKNVLLISEYHGNEKPIKCKCKQCGNEWTTLPKTLLTNKAGCPICGIIQSGKSRRKTHEEFVRELKTINPNIEVLGVYDGTHRKIHCRCQIDGTEWDGYPANLLNKSAGCPKCSMSMSEREMLMILKQMGLNIVPQYTPHGCRHIKKLKFDGFDIEKQIAFEFNGEQHYRAVDFSGHNEGLAEKQFIQNQERDKIKMKYCKEHGIRLVIVPYWERNNMYEFLKKELEKIGETVL